LAESFGGQAPLGGKLRGAGPLWAGAPVSRWWPATRSAAGA
jgi:hypothetical protein